MRQAFLMARIGYCLLASAIATALIAEEIEFPSADVEFFESQIRPLLIKHCFECHGKGDKVEAGLRMTSRAGLLAGGDSGPAIVPKDTAQSLLVQVVGYGDAVQMPPDGKLPQSEIDLLTQWVAKGAPWPGEAAASNPAPEKQHVFRISDEQREFWAFTPVKKVDPPTVRGSEWPHNDIDRFILARLEAEGLTPVAPADKRTLLRRATFDLIGLPPTPEEVREFLADNSADAFAKVVDRLLASPQYGQRWGRRWLDNVRYADSLDSRVAPDADITEAWRYRDWVVDAFNRDLPYDQFIVNQLAGDLLPSTQADQPNVDGLIATGFLVIGEWGSGEADKQKMMTDIVDDQINVVSKAVLGLTISCARCHDHKFDPISNADYYALAGIFFSTHVVSTPGHPSGHTPVLKVPLVSAAKYAARKADEARIAALQKRLEADLDVDERAAADTELVELKGRTAEPIPLAVAAQEGGVPNSVYVGTQDARIQVRGSYTRLGEVVPRRFPQILAGENQAPIADGSGRLQLARWLTSADHPLTARVMANRIWQYHFGQGIVRTPSNFGKLGERPTHPELLDYLASRFIASGLSIKAMHRAIMLSATYQQSSPPSAAALTRDPENRLLSHFNRRRLEAEEIRDSLLVFSGRLDTALAGVSIRDFNSPRRTLYLTTVRSDRSGFGALFDVADAASPTDVRTVSTVAPQALFMLNHPFAMAQAEALAQRMTQISAGDDERVEFVHQLLFGRAASGDDLQIAKSFAGDWTAYCQILLCSNELIFVD